VLVIHPGALGDVLQAVPALRALGSDARVVFCGQPRLGELLCGVGAVAESLSFDGFGLEALFTDDPISDRLTERIAGFRTIVSWFGSRDETYCGRLHSVMPRAEAPSAGRPGCVVAPPVPGGSNPVWQHLLDTLQMSDHPGLHGPLDVPASWRVQARHALGDLGLSSARSLLVVHPGAGGRDKVTAPDIFATAIAEAMNGGIDILIHEGPADRGAADRFAKVLGAPARRLAGPALPLLAGVLSLARAYLGGDSGVSHLAAAVGARGAILSPPDARQRWAPWSPTTTVVPLEGDGAAAASATAAALRDALIRTAG